MQFHCFNFYVYDITNSQVVSGQWAEQVQRPMLNASHPPSVRIGKSNFIGKAAQHISKGSGRLLHHDEE